MSAVVMVVVEQAESNRGWRVTVVAVTVGDYYNFSRNIYIVAIIVVGVSLW